MAKKRSLVGKTLGKDYVEILELISDKGGIGDIYKGRFEIPALIREGIKRGDIHSSLLHVPGYDPKKKDEALEKLIEKNTDELKKRLRKTKQKWGSDEFSKAQRELLQVIDPRIKAHNLMCAVKILREEINPSFKGRFQREGDTLSKLIHPNIVSFYGFGHDDEEGDFILMELLNPIIEFHSIPEPYSAKLVEKIIDSVIDALEYAHGKGYVHRDIKPSNIMICEDPDGDFKIGDKYARIKLCDLGLAKVVEENLPEENKLVTRTGEVIGTPPYMSPEQARGKEATSATDIWMLGATTYHISTAKLPYTGKEAVVALRKIIDEEPEPPKNINKKLPSEIERLIYALMAKNPEHRLTIPEIRLYRKGESSESLKEKLALADLRLVQQRGGRIAGAPPRHITSSIPTQITETGQMTKAEEPKSPLFKYVAAILGAGVLGFLLYQGHGAYNRHKNKSELDALCNQTINAIKNDEDVDMLAVQNSADEKMRNLSVTDAEPYRKKLIEANSIASIDKNLDSADNAIAEKDYKEAGNAISAAKRWIFDTDEKSLSLLDERFLELKERAQKTEAQLGEGINVENLETLLAEISSMFEQHNYLKANEHIKKAADIMKHLPQNKYKKQEAELFEYSSKIIPKLEAINNFETALKTLESLEISYTSHDRALKDNKEIDTKKIRELSDGLRLPRIKIDTVKHDIDAVKKEQYEAAKKNLEDLEKRIHELYLRNMRVIIRPIQLDYEKLHKILEKGKVDEEEVSKLQFNIRTAKRKLDWVMLELAVSEYGLFEKKLLELDRQTVHMYAMNLVLDIAPIGKRYEIMDNILKKRQMIEQKAIDEIKASLDNAKQKLKAKTKISYEDTNAINEILEKLEKNINEIPGRNLELAAAGWKGGK